MSDLLNPATKTIDEWPATAGRENDLSNDYFYEWRARAGHEKKMHLTHNIFNYILFNITYITYVIFENYLTIKSF
jgi:hypothetical protein